MPMEVGLYIYMIVLAYFTVAVLLKLGVGLLNALGCFCIYLGETLRRIGNDTYADDKASLERALQELTITADETKRDFSAAIELLKNKINE
ncbi:hypothetical protein EXT46_05250 [Pseudoalteromonas sp. CO325X]|uniref:hypothetical protein n=1 Tax=Pseudoalteromonas sp. CO325X TaxID=1777262 RepID=UPI001023823A|nr:hypothetical protein [Pseudoalteromonas sp. CO325X]RZF83700.1 hypothetical protein EXT46_05250 [Pseudoalteromonas sp. CO325X]